MRNVDITEWHLIMFPNLEKDVILAESTAFILTRRDWLETHASGEWEKWMWLTGNRFARGVYIRDDDIAIMFKLKFSI